MSFDIEKKQKELQVQFEELQKKEKDALEQMEKINGIRNQIREELCRLQGEYRAFEKLKGAGSNGPNGEGREVESGKSEVNEGSRGSSKVVGSIGAGKSS